VRLPVSHDTRQTLFDAAGKYAMQLLSRHQRAHFWCAAAPNRCRSLPATASLCKPFASRWREIKGLLSCTPSGMNDAKESVMDDNHCPKCGSSDVESRTVKDLLSATDPRGQTFEITLHLPVWNCRACKLCWQGHEAQLAKEVAYQNALVSRSPTRTTAPSDPRS